MLNQSKKEKTKKTMMTIQSTQSFSPIQDVSEGIIITKDRRFIKILEISPINFLLRSEDEKRDIIANFDATLRIMPVTIQFKVISRKTDVTRLIKGIEKDIETEQNKNCRTLQKEQIDLIKSVSSKEGVSRRFFIIFEYSESVGLKKTPSFYEIKADLDTTALRIQNMLFRCGNEVMPLENDEDICEVLYTIMAKSESEKKPFETRMNEVISKYLADENYDPDKEAYVPINDYIAPLSIDTKTSPKYIKIDDVYYSFGYIQGKSYGESAVAGWLSMLINLGEGIDVDFFVHKENIAIVTQKLQYALRYNKVKARGMEDTSTDFDDISSAIRSGYYLKAGIASGEDFCYMSTLLTITAHSIDELEWKTNEIKTYLIGQGLKLKLCWFMQEEAFKMSLPVCQFNSQIFKNSKRNLLSSSLAAAYPFVAYEVNDENGILYGINKANNSLVILNNFDSRKYKNANIAILGTTGAGKTYTLQCMALRMRSQKKQVFIIAPDKGHEFKRACDGIGGQYVKISAGSSQNINVMEIRKKDDEAALLIDGDSKVAILTNKIQQLHTFFTLLIRDITNEERQLLDEALVETYAEFGITIDNDSLIDPQNPSKYKQMPILGDLHRHLHNLGPRAERLYNILSRYVTGSASSFNGHTNVNLDNQYIVFDISDLTEEMLPIGMFIVVDYVWDKVREDRTKEKAIFLDELWTLIGANASEEAAKFVLRIFKVIRAYGGSAIASTQDLNDFFALKDGVYGKGIINNSKIKMVLQLEQEEALRVSETLNLSESEVQQITHFQKGESLLTANSNHILIKFKSSKHEHDLVTTDREDLAKQVEEKRKALQRKKQLKPNIMSNV